MDLNTILIILGVIALIFLVIHGIWSNRKEKSQYFKNQNIFTQESRVREPQEPIQDDNLSTPTYSRQSSLEAENPSQQPLDFEHSTYSQPSNSVNVEKTVDEIKISLPKSSKPKNKPVEQSTSDNIPNLANVSIADLEANIDPDEGINSSSPIIREQLSKISQGEFSTEEKVEYPMNSRPKPQYRPERPILKQEVKPETNTEKTINLPETQEIKQNSDEPKNNAEENFIMLYIVAPENREFNGANIAQVLDNLGFIHGNKQIYHRHLDLSITSPIIFSVANIQQPGTFDPENMMDFYTIGLAIFMQLPSYGKDLANLRLMIRAAKTIAEELGGFVLTDKQEIFTDQAEQEYLNRVA